MNEIFTKRPAKLRRTLAVIAAAAAASLSVASCANSAADDAPAAVREVASTASVDAFVPWLVRAGAICPQITPSLLAAVFDDESGFQPQPVGANGVGGYGQLSSHVWAVLGYPVDDHGNKIGPNGTGDPNKISDAAITLGEYMCFLANSVDAFTIRGTVVATDDPNELYLAAFIAGESAIMTAGGFPNDSLTRSQTDKILAAEQTYRWIK